MTKHPLILIAGWAHPSTALEGLASRLSQDFSVTALSVHDLPTGRGGAQAASPYAVGLISLLEQAGSRVRGKSLPASCSKSNDRASLSSRKPVVAGWSIGGMVSLEAAARRPELFGALVLIGACARFSSPDGKHSREPLSAQGTPPSRLRAMMLGLKRDRRLTLRRFFEQASAPGTPDPKIIEQAIIAATTIDDSELIEGLKYLGDFDVVKDLNRIKTPTLVLHGKRDQVVPWQAAEFLCSRLPSCRCVFDDETGHYLPVSKPGLAASEIVRVLREISQCSN